MANTRGQFSALLAPDIRDVYLDVGKKRPLEYPLFFNISDMEWNPVTDRQISGLGQMPDKPEGSQFKKDSPILGGGKSYLAVPYGLAIEFTWELWRDELYGIMRTMARELKTASMNRQEVQAWSILNNAFNTSFPGFTSGESLCSTSHATYATGSAQANRPTPDIGFSITYLQGAIRRFESMTNERGLPQLMSPVMAVIDPLNKFAAREIFGSSNVPYSADNEINALVEEDMTYMVSHYLTTNTYHFLTAAKGEHDLHFLWRDHPMEDSFDDPWTKNAVFSIYQRHTEGYGSWKGVDGSTG